MIFGIFFVSSVGLQKLDAAFDTDIRVLCFLCELYSCLVLLSCCPLPSPPLTKCPVLCPGSPTSGDETDGAEEACLCVVHLDGQQLVGKGEHQVGEWAEASVVHLRSIEGQPVRKGHGVLVGGVPRTDAQDLTGREGRQRQAQSAGI